MKRYFFDSLEVQVFNSRDEMGTAAAAIVAEALKKILHRNQAARMIFAAAPSQQEFLESLASDASINWKQVTAFHMDEYVDLPTDAPQGFGNFLRRHFFDKIQVGTVHYLNGNAINKTAEAARYAKLLQEKPIDIVCLGIGENTHLAFNDPHVARFNDPYLVKLVTLDALCRQQQVNDGCFRSLDEVPEHALTLTIPALFNAAQLFCMVPGNRKAGAVVHTLTEAVSEKYPSTILRMHPSALLFLDEDSAAKIKNRSFSHQTKEK